MSKIINGVEYNDLNDLLKMNKFSNAEIAEMRLKAEIVDKLLQARKGKGITQHELENISGVSRPLISRIEKGHVDPQLTTILKILKPLGFTLAVVPEHKVKLNMKVKHA
jgi:predicted transcriptional regulator